MAWPRNGLMTNNRKYGTQQMANANTTDANVTTALRSLITLL
jgi:hypothetical protein